MTTDTYLGFDLIASSQNQKEVTANAALGTLSAAMNKSLAISFTANARTLSSPEFKGNFMFTCGALTAPGTLTVPLTSRFFAISNVLNNSPAYTVTVQGSSGAAAIVTGGALGLLYCDGVGVYLFP